MEYPRTGPYNYIEGTDGDDDLTGTDGADYFHNLGGGSDTVNGGDGNDFFLSDLGYDRFIGGGGIDTVSYANETLGVLVGLRDGRTIYDRYGGSNFESQDSLNSIENVIRTDRNDTIAGTYGDNQLEGGGGNDYISGLRGNDTIYGGAGNDQILGDDGSDIYIGGADADIFVVFRASDTQDIIRDFNPSEGDKIEMVRYGTVRNLAELYADGGVEIISVTNDTDHTGNDALDTVFRFDRGSTGMDDSDYLLILEGFIDPIMLDYFQLVTD